MVRWLAILVRTLGSTIRTQGELALENLALRQQVAVWKVRQPRPQLTATDRLFWVVLSRLWKNWRSSAGGAARDSGAVAPSGLQALLGMEESTPTGSARDWDGSAGSHAADEPRQSSLGCTRIHGELLKLGLTVSQATVSKYMPRQRRPPSQVWRTFLKNHAQDLIALDFFTVPTATFRVLFVLVVLSHGRRRLRHFNITEHPTAEWTARQLIEACGPEDSPRYLIRDRDQVYGERFSRQARMLDIRETVTAPRSLWQNAYAERVIGSIRRECLDHIVVIGERHLRGILSNYVDYHNETRTHLALAKDAPEPRSAQAPSQGRVVEVPRVGGLHHEYRRRAA